MFRLSAVAVFLCYCTFLLFVPAIADEYSVNIPSLGELRGTLSPLGIARVWRGIPYATAPRWGLPVPPKPWGVINVTVDGPGCPQICDQAPHTCADRFEESCLFLNIFAPRGSQMSDIRRATGRDLLPIVMFFHGGNYKSGSGNGELYNGEYLAHKHGALYVGVNHRLGHLGFLASTDHGLQGNYGMFDLSAAVAFMQVFGKYFGGDPTRVTLWCQDPMSVPILMTYAFDTYYHETTLPQYQRVAVCDEEEVARLESQSCDAALGERRRQLRSSMYATYASAIVSEGNSDAEVIGHVDGTFRITLPPIDVSTVSNAITHTTTTTTTTSNKRNKRISSSSGSVDSVLKTVQCMRRREAAYLTRINTCADQVYFHNAVFESNAWALPMRTVTEYTDITNMLMKISGCNNSTSPQEQVACAMRLPSDRIMQIQEQINADASTYTRPTSRFMPVSPAQGSTMMPLHVYRQFALGTVNPDIAIMHGGVRDEGNLFVHSGFKKEISDVEYFFIAGAVFGFDKSFQITKWYPADPSVKDQRGVISVVTTDSTFYCPNRNISRIVSARLPERPKQRIWQYLFDHTATFLKETWPNAEFCWTHVCHGTDIAFWNHVGWPKYFTPTREEADLSALMVNYLANFAVNSDPSNTTGVYMAPTNSTLTFTGRFNGNERVALPVWSPVDPVSGSFLRLQANNTRMDSNYRTDYCDFLDTNIGYSFADPI